MKDENKNQCSIDLFPPSLWGKTILHPKARPVNSEIVGLERFATRYVEQSANQTRQAWLTGHRRVRLDNCSLNSDQSCLTMLDTFRLGF